MAPKHKRRRVSPVDPKTTVSASINVRLSEDMLERIDRLQQLLAPRAISITGLSLTRSSTIRALLMRGMEHAEREFGVSEPTGGYVLVDADPD